MLITDLFYSPDFGLERHPLNLIPKKPKLIFSKHKKVPTFISFVSFVETN